MMKRIFIAVSFVVLGFFSHTFALDFSWVTNSGDLLFSLDRTDTLWQSSAPAPYSDQRWSYYDPINFWSFSNPRFSTNTTSITAWFYSPSGIFPFTSSYDSFLWFYNFNHNQPAVYASYSIALIDRGSVSNTLLYNYYVSSGVYDYYSIEIPNSNLFASLWRGQSKNFDSFIPQQFWFALYKINIADNTVLFNQYAGGNKYDWFFFKIESDDIWIFDFYRKIYYVYQNRGTPNQILGWPNYWGAIFSWLFATVPDTAWTFDYSLTPFTGAVDVLSGVTYSDWPYRVYETDSLFVGGFSTIDPESPAFFTEYIPPSNWPVTSVQQANNDACLGYVAAINTSLSLYRSCLSFNTGFDDIILVTDFFNDPVALGSGYTGWNTFACDSFVTSYYSAYQRYNTGAYSASQYSTLPYSTRWSDFTIDFLLNADSSSSMDGASYCATSTYVDPTVVSQTEKNVSWWSSTLGNLFWLDWDITQNINSLIGANTWDSDLAFINSLYDKTLGVFNDQDTVFDRTGLYCSPDEWWFDQFLFVPFLMIIILLFILLK